MLVVDAHQHYWDVSRFDYGWTRQGLPLLDREYGPAELEPQLAAAGVVRSVAVQVLHDPGETRWLLGLAHVHQSIAGVVGWVDLEQDPEEVSKALEDLRTDPKLVGIRHLVHEEPDTDWLMRPRVLDGLAVLERAGVPFDLLLRPQHLRHVPRLSERLPALRMVVDHLAKPLIKNRVTEPWARELRDAAANPNVLCKVSGLVTEADHRRWRPADLAPFVEGAMESFGPARVMYGSDWPVCTLAASYADVVGALRDVLGDADPSVEAQLFGHNAVSFYGLTI